MVEYLVPHIIFPMLYLSIHLAKTAEISNEGEYIGRCMVHLDAFC